MKYLVKMNDKSIRILTLIEGTVEDAIAKWIDSTDVEKFREISESDIPESRDFRAAWADESESSSVDLDTQKVADIILEDMRVKRKEKFKELDAEFIKALSINDQVKLDELKLEQVRLRDITEPVKNKVVEPLNDVVSIEELKALRDLV